MLNKYNAVRNMTMVALLLASAAASAKPRRQASLNATLINKNGISLVFDTDPGGVPWELIRYFGGERELRQHFRVRRAFRRRDAAQRYRANYTVRTIFDCSVIEGGLSQHPMLHH